MADEQLVVRRDGWIFGLEKQTLAGEGDRLSPWEIFSTEGTLRGAFSTTGNSLSAEVGFVVSVKSNRLPDVHTTSEGSLVEREEVEG